MFTQLCKELHTKPSTTLQHRLDDKGRLFYVTFRGDEGTDWGGIYRETLARATSDLERDTWCPLPLGVVLLLLLLLLLTLNS